MLLGLGRSFGRLGFYIEPFRLASQKCGQNDKSALIVLAPGAEEMEFTISADVLRRAKINVTVAGLDTCEPIKCSRGVVIVPDTSLEQAMGHGNYDVVVLPGGLAGNKALMGSSAVGELLRQQESQGGLIAAICAAPTALAKHGIAKGKTLTSHPDMRRQLEEKYCYIDDQNVVQDGNLITSRGPGTSFDFALKIVEELAGVEVAKDVAKPMLVTFKP
ncbi:protein DJ-1alpha-like isoform X1 [Drosophila bipectinata]|uniref:protein DJ-1alpha-like isoform X1 n=2 Tax=Drosophila bipectinata TaxID=42026 RepID=UPI001C890E38|nr:protein DJ-1alpha-like isoform X1 [Drosophila bipectinata]